MRVGILWCQIKARSVAPMKPQAAFAAFALFFCSAVSATELCPEPPTGMIYGAKINESSEASINGKPYVKCLKKDDGNTLGEGYAYRAWSCPTFTVTERSVGLASKMKAAFDKYNLYPKYYEEWTVTDKNGAKWEIYREAYNSGNKPIMTRTSSAVAGGCRAVLSYQLNAPGIDIVIRSSWIETLKKKPVPTF